MAVYNVSIECKYKIGHLDKWRSSGLIVAPDADKAADEAKTSFITEVSTFLKRSLDPAEVFKDAVVRVTLLADSNATYIITNNWDLK